MMNPNLGGSITNDEWISEEKIEDPKELPHVPGFHLLIRPVSAKKKSKGGIIIPDKLQDDLSYLTTVGRVIKVGDLAYGDQSKFPTGHWCKEGDYVCYGKHAGTKLFYKGIRLILLFDDQIIMKVEDAKDLDPTFNLGKGSG